MQYQFNALKFSVAVKIWRNMNGLTIRDMAELNGIAPSSYGFIETGDRTPTIAEFTNLCNTIGFEPREFFGHAK